MRGSWCLLKSCFLACMSASVQNTETTQTPAQGKLSEKTASGVRGQVFLPGESRGQKSLAGCSPWGHRESDTTEMTWLACSGESAKRMLAHRGTGMSLLVPWLRLCAPSAATWVRSLVWELRSSMHSAANHSNDSSKSAEAQLVEVAGTAPGTETSLFGGERQTPEERGSFPSWTCLKRTLQKEAPRLWTPPAASGDAAEPCGRRRLAGSPLDRRHHCQGWRRCLCSPGLPAASPGRAIKKQTGQTGLAECFHVREWGSGPHSHEVRLSSASSQGDLTLGRPSPLSLQLGLSCSEAGHLPTLCLGRWGDRASFPKTQRLAAFGSTQTRLAVGSPLKGRWGCTCRSLVTRDKGVGKGKVRDWVLRVWLFICFCPQKY